MRIALLVAALLLSAPAAAQDKTLRFLLAYPPGASSDILTRLLADRMRVALGQNTIVENRPGAAGIVGTEAAKNAAPDGTTLLMTPLAPEVPTFKELGYPIEASGWYALFAPAGTPKALVDRYARAAVDAIRAPDMKEKLEQMGLEPTGYGPVELAKILRADYDKWGARMASTAALA